MQKDLYTPHFLNQISIFTPPPENCNHCFSHSCFSYISRVFYHNSSEKLSNLLSYFYYTPNYSIETWKCWHHLHNHMLQGSACPHAFGQPVYVRNARVYVIKSEKLYLTLLLLAHVSFSFISFQFILTSSVLITNGGDVNSSGAWFLSVLLICCFSFSSCFHVQELRPRWEAGRRRTTSFSFLSNSGRAENGERCPNR